MIRVLVWIIGFMLNQEFETFCGSLIVGLDHKDLDFGLEINTSQEFGDVGFLMYGYHYLT